MAASHRAPRSWWRPRSASGYRTAVATEPPSVDSVAAHSIAALTGLPALDSALGGLFWGDNVVWVADDVAALEPFERAVLGSATAYEQPAYVCVGRDPAQVAAAFPGIGIIDARPGTSLERPGDLLRAVLERSERAARGLLLFDSLDAMAARWGADTARAFFVRCCPSLLQIGSIAYWTMSSAGVGPRVRRQIEEITQCVFGVEDGRLRIIKAEGRGPGVEGAVFRYRVEDGGVRVDAAPAAARIGAALRAIRRERELSQSELARLAGVSPSAISQAEHGRRGLSLETLLVLSSRLGVTLDELLRGDTEPGYTLGRRHEPERREEGRPVPLLDDPAAGVRTYIVRLRPHAQGSPHIVHKGVEVVTVASGLVQVSVGSGRPVLRAGEALLAGRSAVSGWRNLGESEATLFWVLRDGGG
jgi:transcriptional regulator with XRE-family HTH domain